MEDFKKLGNIEFLNCFLAWHYRKFGFFKEAIEDPRIAEYKNVYDNYFRSLLRTVNDNVLHQALCSEAQRRGLSEDFSIKAVSIGYMEKAMEFSDSFDSWQGIMLANPTFIREINPTDNLGDENISNDMDLLLLDMPVREACRLLNEKGYYTYWSSANREDITARRGLIEKDKNVAYILIDSQNLSDELKDRLLLNGRCVFYGVAIGHSDNGKYYGICAEINSPNALCTDISADLSEKAMKLPSLVNEQVKSV